MYILTTQPPKYITPLHSPLPTSHRSSTPLHRLEMQPNPYNKTHWTDILLLLFPVTAVHHHHQHPFHYTALSLYYGPSCTYTAPHTVLTLAMRLRLRRKRRRSYKEGGLSYARGLCNFNKPVSVVYTFAPTLSGVAGSRRGGGGLEGIGGIRLKINKVQF